MIRPRLRKRSIDIKNSERLRFRLSTESQLKNLAENNLIRFTNLSRKKDAIHANFKVKGLRNGVNFSASISVDITALELHPGDTLEKIIEECARHGVKEFKKSEIQFEGLAAVLSDHLGVAQLG